jgi:hypothetical protein
MADTRIARTAFFKIRRDNSATVECQSTAILKKWHAFRRRSQYFDASRGAVRRILRFAERGDSMSQPRYLTARSVAVDDVLLCRANDYWFGFCHGGERA